MAKIILNVDLQTKAAQAGLDELKKSLKLIADSLKDVKPNKELSEAIKQLSNYYKTLADTAQKANKAEVEHAAVQTKLAKMDAEVAKAEAQKAKSVSEAAQAAAKAVKEDENASAAAARRKAAEISLIETIERHALAQEKRAAAEAKAQAQDNEGQGKLWGLQKAYAALYENILDTAEKYPILTNELSQYAQETRSTLDALVAYNNEQVKDIEEKGELQERLDRITASVKASTATHKEEAEAIRSDQEQMQKWAESLKKAEENAEQLDTKLYGLLKRISNEENRYEAGVFDGIKEKIRGIITETENLDRTDENFVEREKELEKQTADVVNELTKIEATADHAAPAVATLGEKFGNLVERYAKFYASSLLVRKPLQLLQNALSEVGETLVKTEDAVIELNRVLDDPQPAQEVSNRLYDIAYQYGSTFENASTIASNFARAGRSWTESIQATEAALLAMNVAELNATEASDGLLSIIAQFDMEAGDLIDVVDKLNKTADKNPVSTQKLLQAIQRAGSAAKNANVSFDQTLGLITAISEATNRSGQNIGTAINSLIQYSTKNVDVFAELSAESAEVVERFKLGLASIVDVWNQVSADIRSDKTLRDNIIEALGTDDLEELSSTLHDELGDLVSEIDNTYNVANTYRKNYFIALLDNMDRYMTVQEQLTDYQGYSQEENAKYMDTYTAKVNQLNDAWQKLANDEQGILQFKKDLAELGISVIGFIDTTGGIVNNIERIASIATGVIVVLNAEKLASGWTSLVKTLSSLPALLKGIADKGIAIQGAFGWIGIAIAALGTLITAIDAVKKEQEEQRQETINQWKENEKNAETLYELKKKYDELTPESEEYRDVETQIIELLSKDKQDALSKVKQGTDEYREAIENLTVAELNYYKLLNDDAKTAAAQSVKSALPGLAPFSDDYFRSYLRSDQPDRQGRSVGSYSAEELYNEYKDFVQKFEYLEQRRAEALASGDKALADSLKERYDGMKAAIDKYSGVMDEYGDTVARETELDNYVIENAEKTVEAVDNIRSGSSGSYVAELSDVTEATEDLAEATEDLAEGAEEAGAGFDKGSMSAQEWNEYITGSVEAAKAEAAALKAIQEAQAELNTTGTVSFETIQALSKLGEDWVGVLFDENGALDLNSEAVQELVEKTEEYLSNLPYEIDLTTELTAATEQFTEKAKDLTTQIDDVQSALSTLTSAQAEYDETGSLSIDTLQKLLDLGSEYLDLIIDEEGQIRLNEQAVEDLKEEKKSLIDKLIEENTAQYALSLIQEIAAEKEHEVGEEAGNAALGVGTLISQLMTLKGESGEAVNYLTDLRISLRGISEEMGVALTPEELDGVIAKSVTYYEKLQSAFSHTDTSSGWETKSSSSSSSSSSSKSTKDEELERLKSIVSLRESELTLMEHQGASEEEQIAKIREIQAGIHNVAEHLRATNASQEDINKQMSEWWTWEEKINKFAEDRQKAAEKEAEEAEKAREKAEEEAKKAAEEAEKARQEAIKAETSRLKQIVADDKARLTLMEKQGKSVSERVDMMKDIQSHLHDEAEWLRQIGAEQAEIDALSAEWWDWQNKILDLYQETLDTIKQTETDAIQATIDAIIKEIELEEEALEVEEKRLAVDNARLNLEEAINKARIDYIQSVLSDYITALSDAETLEQKQLAVAEAREKLVTAQREAQAKAIVEAFKAEKEVKKDTLSLEEKRLAVEKARQALVDAENERTTRVYNEASGQWEYQANEKNVQSARDNLASAIEALNSYVEEQAWAEVSEAVENGSVSEAEVLEILSKWAKESYGNGSPEFVTKIQTAFRKAMGSAASPDSVSGQISAVDSAVKSLNDYLKSEAVKELKAYIAAGNTDASGMRSILDYWLSMGEGGELYEWRDGLMDTLTDAIYSGYYDDTKVQSQIEAVERAVDNLHDYFRSKFKSELVDALKNGTTQDILDALERWGSELDLSGRDSDLNTLMDRVMDVVDQRDTSTSFWKRVESGQATIEDKRKIMEMMQANSNAWWAAQGNKEEQDRLRDKNFALGTSVGWHRKADGRWYDEYDNIVYDKGGVLHGKGGIKATNKPEIILDPELTSKILRPGSEEQFRAFADAMHLMFEHGNRTRYDTPIIRNPSMTDSHNTSYTVNGIPISTRDAENYTIAELFRAMPTARS